MGDGMTCLDVGGAEEVVAEDVVADDGVDVGGGEEANETAKYGKIWYDEDVYDLRSVETEFPAIVFYDSLTSNETLSCEPTVSSLKNNEIDFRISFDESDDEDYTNRMITIYNLCTNLVDFTNMALPPRDQRLKYLRFEGVQYTKGDIVDYESRLAKIYRREVHRVQVFNFRGLTDLMAEGLSSRMLMEHKDAQGQSVFTSQALRRIFDSRGPLVHKLILEFFSTFRSQAPEKMTVTDLFYLSGIDVGSVNVPYLLAMYLRLFASGRKQGVMISSELDDTWARVASGPERQPDVAAGAPEAGVANEGALTIPTPIQVPQPPPPAAGPTRTMAQRLARVEEDVHEIRKAPSEQRDVLDSMARDFSSVRYRTDGASTFAAPRQPDL
nr:hypothetical protein [Tanacetum cinerariifolium]